MFIYNKYVKLSLCLVSCVFFIRSIAGVPDPYQNTGSNNIAYDVPEKFYAGALLSYNVMSERSVAILGQQVTLHSQPIGAGLLAGYKFNPYVSVEMRIQSLGGLKTKTLPLCYYSAAINTISISGLLSYPIYSHYAYTVSVFGDAGYGLNMTHYNYNAGNGLLQSHDELNKGAYHVGFGVNVDWRNNISARFSYDYHQVRYPLPTLGTLHGAHVLAGAIYYNFI